jgi:hypothetical protein
VYGYGLGCHADAFQHCAVDGKTLATLTEGELRSAQDSSGCYGYLGSSLLSSPSNFIPSLPPRSIKSASMTNKLHVPDPLVLHPMFYPIAYPLRFHPLPSTAASLV